MKKVSKKEAPLKLVGLAGGGRQAIMEYLVDQHMFGMYSFDWPVMAAVSSGFGIDPEGIDTQEVVGSAGDVGCSPWELQRRYRQWWLRTFPGVDLAQAARAIKITQAAPEMQELSGVVFQDLATPEQAQFLQQRGGTVIDCRLPEDAPGNWLRRRWRRHLRTRGGVYLAPGRHALSARDVDLVLPVNVLEGDEIDPDTLETVAQSLGLRGDGQCH
jgi:hypothetical protein